MKINDFVFRFANVNGTGSASANPLSADPGKLTAWLSASHVEKAAKKKEQPTP